MLDPIMALPAPSASPCALLGVAGGASSPGTAGPLPLEFSSLWYPLSGRDLPFPTPSGAPVPQSEDVLPAVGTHPPSADRGVGQLCNPSAFKMLSESWAEDVLPGCTAPSGPPGLMGVLLGLSVPTGLHCACCTQPCQPPQSSQTPAGFPPPSDQKQRGVEGPGGAIGLPQQQHFGGGGCWALQCVQLSGSAESICSTG